MSNYDKMSNYNEFQTGRDFATLIKNTINHWIEDTGVRQKDRYFTLTEYLEAIELDGVPKKRIEDKLFNTKSTNCCSVNNILKTTLFKSEAFSLGSLESINFHESLATCVIRNDDNKIFSAESITAIVQYKW